MKTYREQYDELRFSPEEKQAMVENLLAAAPETRRRVSHKKRVHVLIAAVIAAALCAACASGALRSASEVFANLFGASQEQASLLEQLGTPLDVSCTQDGLTITADAILADEYTYAILYSIQREDGTIRTVPLGDGPWELSFDFTPKVSSIDLPTGQQFQVDGLDCTLTRVSLSPLSLHVEYTVDAAEVTDENAFLQALPVSLTKTDGTVSCVQKDAVSGLRSSSDGDQMQGRKDLVFSEITPMDSVKSISIGDLTVEMPQ